jgi:hypothetical protein
MGHPEVAVHISFLVAVLNTNRRDSLRWTLPQAFLEAESAHWQGIYDMHRSIPSTMCREQIWFSFLSVILLSFIRFHQTGSTFGTLFERYVGFASSPVECLCRGCGDGTAAH